MKRIFHFLLCLTLVFSLITPFHAYAEATWPDYVPIQAEGGIVIDADTGTVLYGKNIHTAYYPASITKIMTALVVIENCSLDEMVTFSHNAVYNVEAGSSSAGLDEGDVLSVRDCLYALLLKSANESRQCPGRACSRFHGSICGNDERQSGIPWLPGFPFCQSKRLK